MKTILQTACVILVSIGIAYELCYKAPLGYVLIAVGSLAFAVSTKLDKKREKEGP